MPNVSITLYLNDEDFVKYAKNKIELNKNTRYFLKNELEKVKE